MSESVHGLEVRVRAVAKALTKEEECAARLRLAGYSTAQIADAMGKDEETVLKWLTRVQELLAAEERAAEERVAKSARPRRRSRSGCRWSGKSGWRPSPGEGRWAGWTAS